MPIERVDDAFYFPEGYSAGESSVATTVQASATAHNDGTLTLIGVTDDSGTGIIVNINALSAAYRALLDITMQDNAGANQVTLLEDFLIDSPRADSHGYSVYLPISFVGGGVMRFMGRLRASSSNVTCGVSISGVRSHGPSDNPLTAVDTYGVDTTVGSGASSGTNDSGGSTVDPGASANTRGAWKELSASIPNAISWLMLSLGLNINTAATTTAWVISVATGAGGSEQVVATGPTVLTETANDCVVPNTILIPCVLPAGARLAVAAECTITDATDRLLQVAGYGYR